MRRLECPESAWKLWEDKFMLLPCIEIAHSLITTPTELSQLPLLVSRWYWKVDDIKSNPITGLDRPLGFQQVETPRFLDNRHVKVDDITDAKLFHTYLVKYNTQQHKTSSTCCRPSWIHVHISHDVIISFHDQSLPTFHRTFSQSLWHSKAQQITSFQRTRWFIAAIAPDAQLCHCNPRLQNLLFKDRTTYIVRSFFNRRLHLWNALQPNISLHFLKIKY
jgi:hypothetical protein